MIPSLFHWRLKTSYMFHRSFHLLIGLYIELTSWTLDLALTGFICDFFIINFLLFFAMYGKLRLIPVRFLAYCVPYVMHCCIVYRTVQYCSLCIASNIFCTHLGKLNTTMSDRAQVRDFKVYGWITNYLSYKMNDVCRQLRLLESYKSDGEKKAKKVV